MLNLEYKPEPIVDIATISHREWLETRRKGIGGSDAAAVLNQSSFKTRQELYIDKAFMPNPAKLAAEEDYAFRLQFGHAMEDVLAEWFAHKYEIDIVNDTVMYRHPLFPWMIADLDRKYYDEEAGEWVGVEIKTTNFIDIARDWAPGKLGEGGKLPRKYELQVRHYMAVMNINRFRVICGYDNDESNIVVVDVYRDLAFEEELIAEEDRFWHDYVLAHVRPAATYIPDKAYKRITDWINSSVTSLKSDVLKIDDRDAQEEIVALAEQYDLLHDQKAEIEQQVEDCKARMNAIALQLIDAMGDHTVAIIPNTAREGEYVELTYKPQQTTSVDKKLLQKEYPEAYAAAVTVNPMGKRPFSCKIKTRKSKAVS